MTTVFIHFWLLQSSESDKELSEYWQEKLKKTLSQCKDDTKSLILDVTPELIDMRTQIENLQNFIDQVKHARPELKIFLIFNESIVENVDLKFDKVDDILCLDYLLLVYFSMLSKKTPYFIPSWNPDNDKLLFLIRRPFGQHRIGLLRRLFDLGMKNDLKWSLSTFEIGKNHFLLPPDKFVERCSSFLPGMTTEEVREFIEKNSKIIGDNVGLVIGETLESAGDCSSTNSEQTITEMYDSVLGEIVSETMFNISQPIFITEKTFKAIAHHMPFIIVGQEKIDEHLRNMGFYTFDIDDISSALNQKIIEILNNTSSTMNQKIIEILNDGIDPTIFFQTSYHVDRFPKFYEEFKDENWPIEISWDNIKALPINIQAEIIEGFFSVDEIRLALRLHTIINRISSFKDSLLKNKEKVKMMTEHNFKKFHELGEKYISNIMRFLTKNNIDLDYLGFLELLWEKPIDVDVYERVSFRDDFSN